MSVETLEYMRKQRDKHFENYRSAKRRGERREVIENIKTKYFYYQEVVELLEDVANDSRSYESGT